MQLTVLYRSNKPATGAWIARTVKLTEEQAAVLAPQTGEDILLSALNTEAAEVPKVPEDPDISEPGMWRPEDGTQPVAVYTGRNGTAADKAKADTTFIKGGTYVIEDFNLGRTHSTVKLAGINGRYNSVMFLLPHPLKRYGATSLASGDIMWLYCENDHTYPSGDLDKDLQKPCALCGARISSIRPGEFRKEPWRLPEDNPVYAVYTDKGTPEEIADIRTILAPGTRGDVAEF